VQVRRSSAGSGAGADTRGSAAAPTASATNPAATTEAEVSIPTPDGACDAYFVHPTTGAAPAVLIWPDIFGLRPAFRQMGKRLAESGYAVLVVNPFLPKEEGADLGRERLRRSGQARSADGADADAHAGDRGHRREGAHGVARRATVRRQSRKMGTTGYCMGGPLVFRTAATNPDRVGAAATFHGGGLVTDKPEAPTSSFRG